MGRIKKIESQLRRNVTDRWRTHLELRLAYERQMLEAQGGTAAAIDIEPGGLWRGSLIVKANKSHETGRVTSVEVKVPRVKDYDHRARRAKGCEFDMLYCKTERAAPGDYTPPTPKSLEALKATKAAVTAAKKKANAGKPKLLNPTREDAETLQAIWNERNERTITPAGEVVEMTQKAYSARSKGGYAICSTVEIQQGGRERSRSYRRVSQLPAVAKGRTFRQNVVILTDKPQKPLGAMLDDPRPMMRAAVLERFAELQTLAGRSWLNDEWTHEAKRLFHDACVVGLAYHDSQTQFGLSEEAGGIAREKWQAENV